MKKFLLFGLGVLFWTGASVAHSEDQVTTKIFDRQPYFLPGTETSDDVQRVPMPKGYNAPKGTLVLVGGRLWDGSGKAPRPATVVIEGKYISRILKPGEQDWPEEAKHIDITGKTVMPGLIDLHTHLTYVDAAGLPPALSSKNQADATLRALSRLEIYLQSGITSVRDLASHGQVPFVLKRWQAQGKIPGPRIFPAGQLITGRGGHGTEGFSAETAPGYPDAAVREASGPDDWRDAVRIQFKQGADVIKIGSHYSQAEISAAVEEAHALGLPVTVDAETKYIEMAIKAGVDSIEHPLPRPKQALKLMHEAGIDVIPTLIPYKYILQLSGGYFGSTSRRFSLNTQTIKDMLVDMKDAGLKIGVGTDLVADWIKFMPDAYIDELGSLVEAGFSTSKALEAATRSGAEILKMGDKLGTLQVGKLADVIVVEGAPDQNLDDLRNIDLVIVGGRLMVRGGRILKAKHQAVEFPKQ